MYMRFDHDNCHDHGHDHCHGQGTVTVTVTVTVTLFTKCHGTVRAVRTKLSLYFIMDLKA